ncbi:MAG: DNA repair protein RadC [Rudaea sp.]|uniref:RadC family protein n=1 Tax=unclassified Rudaea TaxID=2627037 RepID=UPI0010FA08B2|nr:MULTISPECIES: DNA repair protein RadC [unclassified Rudaea]MBN8885197.1 DNA repair protein RadC [Rudaea sp.]MBR0347160.1 DNA repair protein RadC [Rudaea sp.]
MTILNWPAEERPREKLLARGAAALSDAELIAIFLGSGRRGRSAVDLGRDLLSRDGGLKSLLELDAAELSALPGLGAAKACRLHAALELGRRYLAVDLDRPHALSNPLACAEFVRARLGRYPYEVFACLFLDSRNRMIAFEELFRGSVNGTSVHLREVVRRCIAHNAAAVIFAHNHPSGIAEPSQADKEVTVELKRALRLIDVRVHDHLIVGATTTTSLAQAGFI